MNDDELREMIRGSIARHLGPERSAKAFALPPSTTAIGDDTYSRSAKALAERSDHASHLQFPLQRGGDGDGACLIEPSVRCTHCGYCLSYGH